MDKLGKSSSGTITARLHEGHNQYLTADQIIEKFLVKSGLTQSCVKNLLDPIMPKSTQAKGLIGCLRAALSLNNEYTEVLAATTSSQQNVMDSKSEETDEYVDLAPHNEI